MEYVESDCTQDLYHQQQLEQQEKEMSNKYEAKLGSIAFFKADKGDNEKRPDYTGYIVTLKGEKLQAALWITESQKGETFLSGRVQEPYSGAGGDGVSQSASDVPF